MLKKTNYNDYEKFNRKLLCECDIEISEEIFNEYFLPNLSYSFWQFMKDSLIDTNDFFISFENWKKYNSFKKYSVTKERKILRYGKEKGEKLWNEYVERQRYTCSKEYFVNEKGLSEEEWKKYNKERAVTKELCIKRHGKEKGEKLWNEYVERQRYTNSEDYFVNEKKLAKEDWLEYNKKKSHVIENYIEKYKDEDLAKEKLENFFKKTQNPNFHSKISQDLFWKVYDDILIDEEKSHTYFAEHNKEYGFYSNSQNKFYFYDFVITNLNFCIEFHGDHYHGNPKFYKHNQKLIIRNTNCTAMEKWISDEKKINALLQEKNINTIIVWENDYKTNLKNVLDKIKKEIEYARFTSSF